MAVIDCGTNTTRLLVAGPNGRELHRQLRITRLGAGVDKHRLLSGDAIDRTLSVLRDFRAIGEHFNVARTLTVATSAVRDAENGDEFLGAAAIATGGEAICLSGQEEGRLAYQGAAHQLNPSGGQTVMVVDIGGGSTELIVRRRTGVVATSLQVGSVRLTERFLLHDPPTARELRQAAQAVDEELRHALTELPTLRRTVSDRVLVGLAGTVTTLAALVRGLPAYSRKAVHHSSFTRQEAWTWYHRLLTQSSHDRRQYALISQGREDIIVAGILILARLMTTLSLETCLVSEADILDGIALELLGLGTPGSRDIGRFGNE